MKKIDKLVLGAFLGPFLMTFLVVVFILLTQHMLKYFDDIIGKGLGAEVITQLLFYFAIFMTPVALPLAVLLSSLIAFGNLGEHFELTAIKASGISLVRTLRPIFFFVILLTGVAFYANNNLVPKAALEAYSLLYDIKQKKPALDLREGSFYNGINDISIKVNKKYPDGISLRDVVVYDHRKNDGNKEVTVADSGKMYTILNERYLKFELFNGYNFSEGGTTQRDVTGKGKVSTETLTRSKFSKTQIVFDLSSFQFERTDKKWFQGNRIMRNLNELKGDMDSIRREMLSQRLNYYQYHPSYFAYYSKSDTLAPLPDELKRHQQYKDSMLRLSYAEKYNSEAATAELRPEKKEILVENLPPATNDSSVARPTPPPVKKKVNNAAAVKTPAVRTQPKKPATTSKTFRDTQVKPNQISQARLVTDSARRARLDSLFNLPATRTNLQSAANSARHVKQSILNSNASYESFEKELAIFKIQWHKILASSLACVAMFLIGAPLGAIIKKGGLGMPFLVSIMFFIIYYVITMQGEKLAKQGTISPAAGVWMADILLFIIGMVFLRQARADARLFEADFYNVVMDKVRTWWAARKNRGAAATA
jgi:lipopolysaccharide export system permease protein